MKGIQAGNDLHVRWTDGYTIQDRGVEHLLSTEVARALFKAQNKKDGSGFVHLEASPLEILEYGPKKRGRLEHDLRSDGRVDVVLCDRGNEPIAVVEVKRLSRDMLRDAPRVAAILRRCNRAKGGTLRYGCLASIRVRKTEEVSAVKSWLQTKLKRIQPEIEGYKLVPQVTSGVRLDLGNDDIRYAFAICVMLKPLK